MLSAEETLGNFPEVEEEEEAKLEMFHSFTYNQTYLFTHQLSNTNLKNTFFLMDKRSLRNVK